MRYNDPSGEASFLVNIKSSIKSIVNKILNSSKPKTNTVSTAKKNSGSSGSWGSSKTTLITNGKTTPASNNKTWDSVTDARIKSLDKRVQGPATRFINRTESELNTKLRVTDGYRSYEQQEKLYWQSRTEPPTGPWATNARGGESNHNFGMAIDVTVMENGIPYAKPISEDIVKIGKEEGFSWGGDWPKPYTDYPHFEFLIDNE